MEFFNLQKFVKTASRGDMGSTSGSEFPNWKYLDHGDAIKIIAPNGDSCTLEGAEKEELDDALASIEKYRKNVEKYKEKLFMVLSDYEPMCTPES